MRFRDTATDTEYSLMDLKKICGLVYGEMDSREYIAAVLGATIRNGNDLDLIGTTRESAARILRKIYDKHPEYSVY